MSLSSLCHLIIRLANLEMSPRRDKVYESRNKTWPFLKGISGAGNPSSLTNFDAHARPNKIYVLDVCSVLTRFRERSSRMAWRRRFDLTHFRDEDRKRGRKRELRGERVSSSLHDVATRLSTRRLALIKSLDPSWRTRGPGRKLEEPPSLLTLQFTAVTRRLPLVLRTLPREMRKLNNYTMCILTSICLFYQLVIT